MKIWEFFSCEKKIGPELFLAKSWFRINFYLITMIFSCFAEWGFLFQPQNLNLKFGAFLLELHKNGKFRLSKKIGFFDQILILGDFLLYSYDI